VRLRNIQRDDVSQWRIFLADQEAHNLSIIDGDQTFRSRLRQVVAQHRFRVGDSGRKARLVELEDRGEIVRLVLADGQAHAADSMVLRSSSENYFASANAIFCYSFPSRRKRRSHYFSGGACANRSPNAG